MGDFMQLSGKNHDDSHDEQLLTREEILIAIELMIARMDAIDANCADGFPLYSPGRNDQWISPGFRRMDSGRVVVAAGACHRINVRPTQSITDMSTSNRENQLRIN